MRPRILQTFQCLVIGLLFGLGSKMATAEVVVVVSARSEVSQLERIHVENIFFGRNYTFPGGSDAIPFDLEEGALERDEFYMKLTGRTAAQVKSFWAKLIFTGRGRPPVVASDQDELINRLIANPNAIGYIDSSRVDERLKIVYTPMLLTDSANKAERESIFSAGFATSVEFLATSQ